MLDLSIDVSQIDGAARLFAEFPERLKKNLQTAMQDSEYEVLKEAKDRVHVITGTLRRSITAARPEANAEGGWTGRVGTNVVYAAMEEFGFKGVQQVRSFVRSVKSRNVSERRKKIASGVAYVRAHSRNVNRTGHPYLTTGLAASRAEILRLHETAITKTMTEMAK